MNQLKDVFYVSVEVCEHGDSCTVCCWHWRGKFFGNGYGRFRYLRKNRQVNRTAHRVMWLIVFRKISKDLDVCHDCPGGDNRWCVNPNHLWLGTAQDNVDDMWKMSLKYVVCMQLVSTVIETLLQCTVCL